MKALTAELPPLPLALPAPNPNHSRDRLGECIARIRERVASAERESTFARARHREARALICSGETWAHMDAIFADDSYVEDFEARLRWHKKSLAHHEAFFRQLHGGAAA